MLRAKLAPLNADQLADVIRGHKLDPADLTSNLSADKLRDWIVDAVERGDIWWELSSAGPKRLRAEVAREYVLPAQPRPSS